MPSTHSRRQFLRNTTLSALAIGALPQLTRASARGKEAVDCDTTTLDYYGQGPFYTAGAPDIVNNQLAEAGEPGTRLIISGVVRNLDCSEVIPDAVIDIWHADDAGTYDGSGFNLRGKAYSNPQGFYLFETILPGKYLNGASYRPRHIHFKITPPSYPTLTTQLYFEGDTDIPGDAAASITSGTYDATHRIIPIALNGQGKWEGTWDIVVDGDGVTGLNDIHLDKGMIYSASPNPFTDTVDIHYGLFKNARASVHVFDVSGALIAILDDQQLSAHKYHATWKPQGGLAPGHYFVALKVNDLQVHYLKVAKV